VIESTIKTDHNRLFKGKDPKDKFSYFDFRIYLISQMPLVLKQRLQKKLLTIKKTTSI